MRGLRALALLALVGSAGIGACDSSGDPAPEPAIAAEPDLRALMTQLDTDMAKLNAGIFRDDLAAVESAARAIAEHPKVSASERKRIHGVLGEELADFAKGDQLTHKSAAALAAAAAAGDRESLLREHDTLTRSCVSCHDQFRARLGPGT